MRRFFLVERDAMPRFRNVERMAGVEKKDLRIHIDRTIVCDGNTPMKEKTLAGRLLVATPSMEDPVFAKTVLLLVGYDEKMGALGIVLNRETSVTLEQACEQLNCPCTQDNGKFFGWGGPVAGSRGFIVHSPMEESPAEIFQNEKLSVSSSVDILKEIAAGRGPSRFFIALGCAGWTPGQLEGEIDAGAWLVAPLDERIIFDIPVQGRYEAALALVGSEGLPVIDVPPAFRMSSAGHA